jgi:homocysteine S-methyltransferase
LLKMSDSLLERLAQPTPMLLDGATGTELGRRGVDLNSPAWTALAILDHPEILRQVHRDHAEAGAEILTANTFRTHARNLAPSGHADQARELTHRAVEIARSVVAGVGSGDQPRFVAGSVAPLGDCYSPRLTPSEAELEREHREMVRHLTDAGVDLILIETQVTIREAVIASRLAAETGVPFFVSFVCNRRGEILSGESLFEGFRAVLPFRPAACLVNCVPAEEVLGCLAAVREKGAMEGGPIRWGAYANTGRLLPDGTWEATSAAEPAVYAGFAQSWIGQGWKVIGGCCGTRPEHISCIREKIYDL